MSEIFTAYVADLRRQGKDGDSVESAIRCWLEPTMGHLPPEECDGQRLGVLVEAMNDVGRANNTIRSRCAIVRSALTFALRAHLIERHPLPSLRGIQPPKRTRPGFNPRRELMTCGTLVRLTCSPQVPHRERTMYLLSATCGVRVAELIELRVGDIDREVPDLDDEGDEASEEIAAALHITRQWKKKIKAVKPPKGGGPRTIPIRPDVLKVLDRWLAIGWRRRNGRSPTDEDLLFPADVSSDRRATNPDLLVRRQCSDNVLSRLHKDLKRVGLEMRRQHAFRHTFVSLLVNSGVPKDVAEQFTHPSPCSSVEIYAHYSYRVLSNAVKRIPLRLREPTDQLELFGDPDDDLSG